ncbi:hypothetical protein [Halobellus ruber]|uniref:CARDB domain-containing protein n=1 Tax=Halobellus ruber TaxID=2761102 RepID=A0A7J9SJM2_9EURY|nr:hypothetical protein [Halobellus ruber]MBB6646583.1 hypothetical protein [Halobellus ruber]
MRWSPLPRVVIALLVVLSGSGVAAVTAADPAIQLSSVVVTPDDPNTGEQVTIDATIANLQNSDTTVDVTDLYVRKPGTLQEFARVENVGSVAPGGSLSVPISTTFDTPGQKRLELNVGVRDEDGSYHSYTYPIYIDVTEPTVRADLAASTPTNDTGVTRISLTNYGNTNLSNVEIAAVANGTVVDRNFLQELPPEASGTTAFDTDAVDADSVTFTATYAAAGGNHTTTLAVDVDDETPVPGRVRLTAIEVSRTGTGVMIQGDAANLGGTDADSVLVRVGDAPGVSPTPPSGEYFVGAVEASEFATFELTARTENASSVPVEITYLVDNERVTTTQRVDLSAAGAPSARAVGVENEPAPGGMNDPRGSGGPPLALVGGAVVILGVIVGLVIYRRRS